jgi:hypothetical protein
LNFLQKNACQAGKGVVYLVAIERMLNEHAGVMELVDVVDSKSTGGDTVPVRVRSPAPQADKTTKLCRSFVRFIFSIKAVQDKSVSVEMHLSSPFIGLFDSQVHRSFHQSFCVDK